MSVLRLFSECEGMPGFALYLHRPLKQPHTWLTNRPGVAILCPFDIERTAVPTAQLLGA